MNIDKKISSKKLTRTGALQSSIIFLIIAVIALLSLWLPSLIS